VENSVVNPAKDLFERTVGVPASELRDTLEVAGRLAVGGIAAAYVSGFFILNLHLRSYGLSGLGLARAGYIMAGVLWLGLLLTMFTGVVVVRWTYIIVRTSRELYGLGRRALSLLLGAIGAYSVLTLPIRFASGKWLGPWTARLAYAVAVVALQAVAVFLVIRSIQRRRIHREQPDFGDPANHPARHAVVALFVMIGSVILYAEVAYPLFLPAYGGGRSTGVRLTFSNHDAQATELRVLHGRDVFLIADTEQWIAVTTEDPLGRRVFGTRRAVRLKSDTVLSIVSSGP
jgi:hypothetical protein